MHTRAAQPTPTAPDGTEPVAARPPRRIRRGLVSALAVIGLVGGTVAVTALPADASSVCGGSGYHRKLNIKDHGVRTKLYTKRGKGQRVDVCVVMTKKNDHKQLILYVAANGKTYSASTKGTKVSKHVKTTVSTIRAGDIYKGVSREDFRYTVR